MVIYVTVKTQRSSFMSYTFVKITTFYRDYLADYYAKNDNITGKSYSEQYDHLMNDSFAWANFYQIHLRKLGVDAHEIIFNALPLQKEWAVEHSVNLEGKDLLIEQLKRIKPDVVFFQDSNIFNGDWIDYLKEEVPSIKNVAGWCCHPVTNEQLKLYKNFDYNFVCSPLFAKKFKDAELKNYILQHAFEKSILEKIELNNDAAACDFLFIGSLIESEDFHNYRTKIIEALLESGLNLKLYSKILIDNPFLLLMKQNTYIISKILIKLGLKDVVLSNDSFRKVAQLREIPRNPKFSKKLINLAREPIYGLKMFQQIANSKITLNIHGGVAGDYAANSRLFESTGVGSCLITDWKKNLNEIFKTDEEVITFKNTNECIDKVRWLLNHPTERINIARKGQQRVLKDHSFEARANLLNEIILKGLNR